MTAVVMPIVANERGIDTAAGLGFAFQFFRHAVPHQQEL